MNWFSLQGNWSDLRCRLRARWSGGTARHEDPRRDRCDADFCRRYGIPKHEARRRKRDWIKDPGVLDDWNDTRSILDM